MSGALRVPRLTNRSATGWVLGTLVVVVLVVGYLAVTQPANRWAAVVVGVLVVLAALAVVGSRQWVDASARTLTWQRFFVLRTTVAAHDVSSVSLVSNRAGGVVLAVGSGSRTRHMAVLVLSQYVRSGQGAAVCEALADVVEAMDTASGKPASVAERLRAQGSAAAKGTPPEKSPLASMASDKFARIAGGGGAAGSGGSWLS